jgi:hypothetical protein
MREAFPQPPEEEACRHFTNAVGWASINHREWLYRGVPHKEWIWPPDHRGVGLLRWVNGRLVEGNAEE